MAEDGDQGQLFKGWVFGYVDISSDDNLVKLDNNKHEKLLHLSIEYY